MADLVEQVPGRRCSVAGLAILRQRASTAKGITFMTLEDETGTAHLNVRIEVWEKFHNVARRAAGILVRGVLQNHSNVIHILVEKMEDLTSRLASMDSRARDFR